MGRSVTISLTCCELADIYIALTIAIDIFGRRDLAETRSRIAEVLYRECGEMAR